MKFLEVFRFEFAYQIRRPWFWLFLLVLIALSFLMARDASLSEVLYADFLLNSSFSVAKTTVFGGIIWLIMCASVAGDAAARDVATGMHPLTYTTQLTRLDYLGGRFAAVIILNAFLLLGVQAGILLGIYLPGVDAKLIGPFRPAAFLTSYAYIAIPNAFAATSIQFALASRSGKPMAAYFGSFLVVFMGFFVASLLLFSRGLGTLLDPIGIRFVVEDIAHLWTTVEKSTRMLALEGIVLQNRLLWVTVGLVVSVIGYLSFAFTHRTQTSWRSLAARLFRQRPSTDNAHSESVTTSAMPDGENAEVSIPTIRRRFGFYAQVRQAIAIARASFMSIAGSWGGIALLVAIPLLTIPVVVDQMHSSGIPLTPRTILVIRELTASLADELSRWVIIPFIIVFFAGELVWRERDARVHDITAALPGSAWTPLLGKYLGLALVLALFIILQIAAGVVAQLILGHHDFQLRLYVTMLMGLQLSDYLLFAMLTLSIHVIVNQKYAGHLVAILIYVFMAISSLFGVEHNLLVFGAAPAWSYTEIRGFGLSLAPWFWFKLYWLGWTLLVAVAARLAWVRGHENALHVRLRLARHQFKGVSRSTAWFAGVLILGVGGFIFYNTNILNEYLTADELDSRNADYERLYAKFADHPQPLVSAASLRVEIYPEKSLAQIDGTYDLVNDTGHPVDSIHLSVASDVETVSITFDRPSSPALTDDKLAYRIYRLDTPLQPGDSLKLHFEVRSTPRGFRENGVDGSVVPNGTQFSNAWLPIIGYINSRELIHASARTRHGLPARPVIPPLEDLDARKKTGNGILFDVVVGTSSEQVAIVPGLLERSWQEGARRYYRYKTSGPVGEFPFFSANYGMRVEQWRDPAYPDKTVAIQVFHHPQHIGHLEPMLRAIKASLNYYSKEFGPYEYDHLTFVERPGLGTGMHADASMITHGEGFTAWHPDKYKGKFDLPSAIIAHEVAHQWTAPIAPVEGAPVMSESIAWYYGMKLVGHAGGPDQLRQLRTFMRESHVRPEIRTGETLLRGLDPYTSYRRGPFALYTLSEYIGEDRVNKALRKLLETHRQPNARLATTLDLYAELKAVTPDTLKYLLHDLFETNTHWDLNIEGANSRRNEDGSWELTIELETRKIVTDSAGVESVVPMDDWIEVGAFADPGDVENKRPAYLEKYRIRSDDNNNKNLLIITTPYEPRRVAIDPRHLLTDRERDNNIRQVAP